MTRLHKQSGVAVITALLLTTLAITIVTSLFWQQQVQVRSIENQRLQLQKQWILRGALDWAGLILREDATHSPIDSLDEPWAVPLAKTPLDQYVDEGHTDADAAEANLSGSISDAQARYNLTNLCPNGIPIPAEVAAFSRLLINVKLNPNLAQATADAMAAALKIPNAATANSSTQSGPQSMSFTQLDDLLAVPGFSPEMLARLRDFVIFLPTVTPVNVNTASPEVLSARIYPLSLAQATTLVASRSSASFRNFTDFTHRLPSGNFQVASTDADVKSNYFLVNGIVQMSRASLEVQALLDRTSSPPKLIWIREY